MARALKKQGIVFCTALYRRHLVLYLFRILPIGFVRLDSVIAMRRSDHREFFTFRLRRLLFWRYWFWPYPVAMVGCCARVIYRLETRHRHRIWLRLTTGMHYQLRELINREQISREGEEGMWTMNRSGSN